jgi:glutamine synthetase
MARMEILQENYCKVVNIEALTAIEMVKKQISPSVSMYCKELADISINKKALGINAQAELLVLTKLSNSNIALLNKTEELSKLLVKVKTITNIEEESIFFNDKICVVMKEMRTIADDMEVNTSRDYWPIPTYGDLLYSF